MPGVGERGRPPSGKPAHGSRQVEEGLGLLCSVEALTSHETVSVTVTLGCIVWPAQSSASNPTRSSPLPPPPTGGRRPPRAITRRQGPEPAATSGWWGVRGGLGEPSTGLVGPTANPEPPPVPPGPHLQVGPAGGGGGGQPAPTSATWRWPPPQRLLLRACDRNGRSCPDALRSRLISSGLTKREPRGRSVCRTHF